MADRQNPNDPKYDWLFTGPRGATSDSLGDDDELTRAVQPVSDHTQVLPVTQTTTSPQNAAQPTSSSFGGTYPAPTSRPSEPAPATPPRFASPSPTQGGATPPPRQPWGSSSAGGPPPARGTTRKWWVRGVLLVLALWLIFLLAVPIWTWSKISKVDAEPDGDRPSDTAGTTYLLVGSDSREGLTAEEQSDLGTGDAAGQRTDTIIVLHVPDGEGPTLLLSVPRDSFVDIPGHEQNKINAAYAFGGPELLVETVEGATDIRIDNYVEVGFAGFVDIVDAVGGITVCPKEAIDDPKAGDLSMEKGCQSVDGHTALGYTRSRAFADGDITRAKHQREVISAVGSKAASWQTVVFPWRYVQVNRAAADTLRVGDNVGPVDLARFAWAMAHTSGSGAKRCVVPYSQLGAQTSAGLAVIWDEEKANALFEAVRSDDTSSISCSADGQ